MLLCSAPIDRCNEWGYVTNVMCKIIKWQKYEFQSFESEVIISELIFIWETDGNWWF